MGIILANFQQKISTDTKDVHNKTLWFFFVMAKVWDIRENRHGWCFSIRKWHLILKYMLLIRSNSLSLIHTIFRNKILNEVKKKVTYFIPGTAIPFLIAIGSLRDHFCTSSFIFWILFGFIAHKQPFLWLPFDAGFSIFSKHLFKLKLCRTEFFQPLGAFLK